MSDKELIEKIEEQIEFCYCGQILKREDKIDFYTLKCPKLQCGGFRMVPKRSAGVAPQPVLDLEKVRQVIAPFFNNDADGSWGLFSPEDMATHALCEAAKRGELSA